MSKRTHSALAARKAQGARLGNRSNAAEAAALGRRVQTEEAAAFAANVLPIIGRCGLPVSGICAASRLRSTIVASGIVAVVTVEVVGAARPSKIVVPGVAVDGTVRLRILGVKIEIVPTVAAFDQSIGHTFGAEVVGPPRPRISSKAPTAELFPGVPWKYRHGSLPC